MALYTFYTSSDFNFDHPLVIVKLLQSVIACTHWESSETDLGFWLVTSQFSEIFLIRLPIKFLVHLY